MLKSFSSFNDIGVPGPSGSESGTYVSRDGYVYKINNKLHCGNSVVATLEKFILHNILFPDTAYVFVGFTGFGGRSVLPVVKQTYIKGCCPASKKIIREYMNNLGFAERGDGEFQRGMFVVKDVFPKNVI